MNGSSAEHQLWELVRQQQERIDALEARLAPAAEPATEARVGRRAVFGLAGAGVAAAAAMVIRPEMAAAADTDPLILGASNNESVFSTVYTKTNVEGIGLSVINSSGSNTDPAIRGAGRTGVQGAGTIGVQGIGSGGAGGSFSAEGVGQLRLEPAGSPGPPPIGQLGSLRVDSLGDLYLCTVAGSPGTWVKLNGQTTNVVQGPTFLPVSRRGYDSRPGSDGSGTKGKFSAGETRTVNIATDSGMPVGKSAAIVNITVTSTETSFGFVSIYSGAVTVSGEPTFSNINWFGPGQTLANSATTAVSPTGTIKIYSSAPTNVLIDVVGHYA